MSAASHAAIAPVQELAERETWTFVSAADFVEADFPRPETLLGSASDRFFVSSGFVLFYGEAGAAKSTLAMDGVAHLAAGDSWLGLEVSRPVRFCIIENESSPGLWQEKIREKAATWEGEPEWMANVFLFSSPWGSFNFARADAREALRQFCLEHQVDIVVGNPLLGLGASGAGKPEQTAEFVEWLKLCGLWQDVGFWFLHHENKAGQISGDWDRHPDTVVLLERDGNRPRTKLTWTKTRWATTGTEDQPRKLLLEWVIEAKSYAVVEADTLSVSDAELRERVDEFLAANPASTTTTVETKVTGAGARIRKVLEGGDYKREPGPRNATLWSLAESAETSPSLSTETGWTG